MDDTPGHDAGPRNFDVPLDWTFPDLDGRVVPSGGRVDVTGAESAHAEYDTATHALRAFGACLSRAAGADASWTLRVGTGRPDEMVMTIAAEGRGVSKEARDLLFGVSAGAALRLVRRVESERSSRVVRDADGVERGEVADVRERSAETGEVAAVQERRRIEVSGWDGPFLAAVGKRLTKAGAAPVETQVCEPAVSDGTVGAALHAYVRTQRDAILRGDFELRRDADAVHSTRVAVRRLRSALRIVDVADPDRSPALGAELSWLSRLLGDVRDCAVLREHLRAAVRDISDEAPLEPTAGLVDAVLEAEERAARDDLTTAMASRRYLALLVALRDWCADPPFTSDAGEPEARLGHYVRAAGRQLDKRMAGAGDSAGGLHRARKAAKRTRYVATFATPVVGKQAAKTAKRAKKLQRHLGDYHDCIVAAQFLQRIAGGADGATAFGCGVLWAHEQDRAERARRRAAS